MKNSVRNVHLSVLFAAAGFVLAGASQAQASHFRYGTLQWGPTAIAGEVKFDLRIALRRNTVAYGSFPGGIDQFAETGDIITEGQGNTRVVFGDGSITGVLQFIVTDFSVTENWITAQALNPGTNVAGILHVYPGAGPYLASLGTSLTAASCCRLGVTALNNRPDGTYPLQSLVFPTSGNRSPSSSLVPIVVVPASATATFLVPAVDPDGDGIRFRLSTIAEAGGGPHPPGITVNPLTGQVTWNNLGLDQTMFWTTQIVVEDVTTSGAVKTKTPVDFLLKIVPASGSAPACSVSPAGPQTVPAGTPVTFTVTGTDADPGEIILNGGGVPVGATMTPALPVAQRSPVSSVLDWTPTAAQAGPHVISFSITDNAGQQALCSKTILVTVNTPPTVSCPAPVTASCTSPGGASRTLTAHVADGNGDALLVTWRVDGAVVKTETVPSGGSTTSANVTLTHTFPLGPHTVQVSVDDGEASVVSCQTTVTVTDTAPPVVSCSVLQSMLWPPNHKLINVGLASTATDACHAGVPLGVHVFGDEDDEDPTGDGRFAPDATDIGPGTLRLRAEREGDKDGRVYLIRGSAADPSGNTGWRCCTVVVPHDMSRPSRADVLAQAAAAEAVCQATGLPPSGYFVIGDTPPIGPKR